MTTKNQTPSERRTTRFRHLIERDEILLMPGVHDVLSARYAEQAGFEAITAAGYGATATLLGQPDISLLTLTEFADHYGRLCDNVSIPVFGDGDTGFGNITNAVRTVKLFERAGLGGMLIEDQIYPKRCGHMTGKEVVPADEMIGKLKAALDARQDPDFVIMARTDALAVNGLDDAIERMTRYREVGADLMFIEAPRDVGQMRRICREIDGPCMANMVDGGLTPVLPLNELQEIGYAAVIYPVGVTYAMAKAAKAYMTFLKERGTTAEYAEEMMYFDEFNETIGLGELRERERKYEEFALSHAPLRGATT